MGLTQKQIAENGRALTNDGVAILSVVNRNAGYKYFQRDTITQADLDDVCHDVFDLNLHNELFAALVNRIGLILFNHRRWDNPLKLLKHGTLNRGEIIEEVFMGLIAAVRDTIEAGTKDLLDINLPEVKTAFYRINWEVKYPVSVNQTELEKAFLSYRALIDFIDYQVGRLYDSYKIDEYRNTKNIMEEWGRRNNYKLVQVPEPNSKENLEELVIEIKAAINEAKFPRMDNNPAQVENWIDNQDPYDVVIFVNGRLDAALSVKVLAAAFNMDEVTFMRSGIKIVMDDFGTLENVVAIVASRDAFKVFDRMVQVADFWNGSNLVRNIWLHVKQVYAASPFEPVYAFVTQSPAAPTGITVNAPAEAVKPGMTVQMTANVTGTGMFDKHFTWNVTGATMGSTEITSAGMLKVGATATGTLTVSAVSVVDGSINGSTEITLQ